MGINLNGSNTPAITMTTTNIIPAGRSVDANGLTWITSTEEADTTTPITPSAETADVGTVELLDALKALLGLDLNPAGGTTTTDTTAETPPTNVIPADQTVDVNGLTWITSTEEAVTPSAETADVGTVALLDALTDLLGEDLVPAGTTTVDLTAEADTPSAETVDVGTVELLDALKALLGGDLNPAGATTATTANTPTATKSYPTLAPESI
jgi:hypothetical protein